MSSGQDWLYRRGDDPDCPDYVRFSRLDPLDRFLIETFRGADLEPELASLLNLPGSKPLPPPGSGPAERYDAVAGLARLEAWLSEDIPDPP